MPGESPTDPVLITVNEPVKETVLPPITAKFEQLPIDTEELADESVCTLSIAFPTKHQT